MYTYRGLGMMNRNIYASLYITHITGGGPYHQGLCLADPLADRQARPALAQYQRRLQQQRVDSGAFLGWHSERRLTLAKREKGEEEREEGEGSPQHAQGGERRMKGAAGRHIHDPEVSSQGGGSRAAQGECPCRE